MLRKLRPRSAYDVMAALAFLAAVAGGTAYAAATIGPGDIQHNAVLSATSRTARSNRRTSIARWG